MTASPREYWGYLIDPETKRPSPRLEQLLLGIAHYLIKNTEPRDHHVLTPAKLSAFYRAVGGDFDALFINTPPASLSFIYTALGCFHSLQPSESPFEPPSIPALTARGFVRWETIQLLLEPDEHAAFLQEAVRTFNIPNKAEGGVFGGMFPANLPRECFPADPDPKMCRWHEEALQKLKRDVEAERMVPRPAMQKQYSGTPGPDSESDADEDAAAGAGGSYFVNRLKDKFQQRFGRGDSRPTSKDSWESRERRHKHRDELADPPRKRRSLDNGRPGKTHQPRSSDEYAHPPRSYRAPRPSGYDSPSSPESPTSGAPPRPPPRRSDYSDRYRARDRSPDRLSPPPDISRFSRPTQDIYARRHSANFPHSTLAPEDEMSRARSRSHGRSPTHMSPGRFAAGGPAPAPAPAPRPSSGYFPSPVGASGAPSSAAPPKFSRGRMRHTVHSPGVSPYRGRKREDEFEKDPGRRLEEGYRYVTADRPRRRE